MTKRKSYSLVAYANGEKVQEFKCASLKDARESVQSYLYYTLHLTKTEAAQIAETPSFDAGFIYTVNAARFVRIVVN